MALNRTRVNHYTLTLSGSAESLASVLGGAEDNYIRYISIQAHPDNGNVAYVGGSNVALTSGNYGIRVEIPESTIPQAPIIFESLPAASMKLGDFFVLGTAGQKLQIMTVSDI